MRQARRAASSSQAVAFGLALACNQLAWFIAPFLLTGIFLIRRCELGRRRRRQGDARYLGIAVGTFAALNAPFFVWGPGAWLHGVTAPLTQHAIPYGQGLVGLTLFLRLGGGRWMRTTTPPRSLYLALLVLYVIRFRHMGRACFILPLLALFVSGRSLAEYWMTTVAVVLVGVVSADPRAIRSVPARGDPGTSFPARPARGRGRPVPARRDLARRRLGHPAAAGHAHRERVQQSQPAQRPPDCRAGAQRL